MRSTLRAKRARANAGGSYEIQTDGSTETVRQYHTIAGSTVAMREGSVMSYFLTDHLGSVVGITDADGTLTAETRYLPFGEVRADIGSITQTDFGYTFQRHLPDMGLMDYRARFYSSSLGRFIQPDSIIPGAGNPQAFNRYSYVNNRPVNFNDPSGHKPCLGNADEDCGKTTGAQIAIETHINNIFEASSILILGTNWSLNQVVQISKAINEMIKGVDNIAGGFGQQWVQKNLGGSSIDLGGGISGLINSSYVLSSR